jgi:hypothetical protein
MGTAKGLLAGGLDESAPGIVKKTVLRRPGWKVAISVGAIVQWPRRLSLSRRLHTSSRFGMAALSDVLEGDDALHILSGKNRLLFPSDKNLDVGWHGEPHAITA